MERGRAKREREWEKKEKQKMTKKKGKKSFSPDGTFLRTGDTFFTERNGQVAGGV